MEQLFDPVRKMWVEATAEERVRQKLIGQMLSLGFPKSLLVVEKELNQLPHLHGKVLPAQKRRIDLLSYCKDLQSKEILLPLVMVECKAGRIDLHAREQIIGYNYYVRAYFLSLANPEEVQTFWWDHLKKKYLSLPYLLSYAQMREAIRC